MYVHCHNQHRQPAQVDQEEAKHGSTIISANVLYEWLILLELLLIDPRSLLHSSLAAQQAIP